MNFNRNGATIFWDQEFPDAQTGTQKRVEIIKYDGETGCLMGILRVPSVHIFCFKETSWFTMGVRKLVNSYGFETFIMMTIAFSVLVMAMDSPDNPEF